MRLRQLPELYLRGSIANETMKHLTPDQRANIDRLTKEISNSPLLAGHRYRFMEKLGQTIGGDYYRNQRAARQEFDIAIWRALVYLLYHRDYTYRCLACGASEYTTNNCRQKAFDRRYPICPACNAVQITDAGASKLQVNKFVSHDDLQRTILRLGGKRVPRHASPIISIPGDKKVKKNHDEVLNDPTQIVKYFGDFVWNYFRQTLRENEIKYHRKGPQKIVDRADRVAVEEIRSLLLKLEVKHSYERNANPYNGHFRIVTHIMTTNQSVSRSLRLLVEKYNKLGVQVLIGESEIMVAVAVDSPYIDSSVTNQQPVCMQGRSASDEGEESIYDAYHANIIRLDSTMQEDGIAKVETSDLIDTIRDSLSDGAQKVFDIMLGQGDAYDEFINRHGSPRGIKHKSGPPHSSHIAAHLGVKPRQVKQWLNDIKIQCYAHGMS